MSSKLIEILLEKIEELEETLQQKETLKQIIDDLRNKGNQNDHL